MVNGDSSDHREVEAQITVDGSAVSEPLPVGTSASASFQAGRLLRAGYLWS